MKINNKGVSLIELVVSIGIMSIVLVLATGMIVNASKYFEKQASHTELQNEAQIITNYLTDTIMEANDIDFTVTDPVTGAGVFEFYAKDETTGLATGKGSQRVLHFGFDGVTPKGYLYMTSFNNGEAAPAVTIGDEASRMYLISDEITEFNVSFEYGEETDPSAVVDTTAGGTTEPSIELDASKKYVVKNPLKIKIIFKLEHNNVSSKFEITADCRNTFDDIKYTKNGVTTIMKAVDR